MSKEVLRQVFTAAAALLICGLLIILPVPSGEKKQGLELQSAYLPVSSPRLLSVKAVHTSNQVYQPAGAPIVPIQEQETPITVTETTPAIAPAATGGPDTRRAESTAHGSLEDMPHSPLFGTRRPQIPVSESEKPLMMRERRPSVAAGPILPEYPRLAREKGIEGSVIIRIEVDINGTVTDSTIDTSSGSTLLDKAALKAVESAYFLPAYDGENPVPSVILVPIRFVLEGD